MKQQCKIWLTTSEGQVLVGFITLDGDKLAVLPTSDDDKALMQNILADTVCDGQEIYDSAVDPAKWFAALPIQYSGSYLRAELVP